MAKEIYNQSIVRAGYIIDLFTVQNDKWSMKDLAKACNIPTTTIVPILKSLEMIGYLERDPDTKLYRIGMKFVKKAQLVTMGTDLRETAHKVLRELSFKYNLNTHLAVMDNGEMIYIDRCEAIVNTLIPSYIGKRIPSYCTALGKAMLAFMNPKDVERIIDVNKLTKYTPHTIDKWPELTKQLAGIREKGYAIDDEEYQLGGYCIGVPIFDSKNNAVASISISIPKMNKNFSKIDSIIMSICEAGRIISNNVV
ncbi:MAG: IclR family transcriptional regulator [Clostridiales bacterium]|nr:IclR family transcriptional regulator [Clostridiales bacterium]